MRTPWVGAQSPALLKLLVAFFLLLRSSTTRVHQIYFEFALMTKWLSSQADRSRLMNNFSFATSKLDGRSEGTCTEVYLSILISFHTGCRFIWKRLASGKFCCCNNLASYANVKLVRATFPLNNISEDLIHSLEMSYRTPRRRKQRNLTTKLTATTLLTITKSFPALNSLVWSRKIVYCCVSSRLTQRFFTCDVEN